MVGIQGTKNMTKLEHILQWFEYRCLDIQYFFDYCARKLKGKRWQLEDKRGKYKKGETQWP